jgi:hypothetical protein
VKLAFKHAGRSWLEWAIALHDEPKTFCHVEIIFSDGVAFSAQYGEGVRFVKNLDTSRGWWKVPLAVSAEEEQTVRQWCESHAGGRYDVPGVLAFKIPFIRQAMGAWFCSEICSTALQQIGMFSDLKPHRLSPNALFLHTLRYEPRAQLQP